MIRKRVLAISILSAIALAIGALVYLFLWGKLFPFSPIIVGFSKHELSNATIYVQNGAVYDDYQRIDTLIPAVESFHELPFKRKPRIFIFRDRNSYLQRSISQARFCAFYNGSIVISPWALTEAKEGTISLEIYLKHELSHVLLFQNKGILTAYRYPKWLLEGIAVYSANQMGTSWYPGKEETYRLIRQGNFMPPGYFETRKEGQVGLQVPYRKTFMYSEFACLVDYLVATGGKGKFLSYMKTLLHKDNQERAFKELYGIDFDRFLLNFKEYVQDSTTPNP
jgi:hypothetical protein